MPVYLSGCLFQGRVVLSCSVSSVLCLTCYQVCTLGRLFWVIKLSPTWLTVHCSTRNSVSWYVVSLWWERPTFFPNANMSVAVQLFDFHQLDCRLCRLHNPRR